MRLARYVGDGKVAIVEEVEPNCPDGGLLIQTEACGLCSGELMSWYMDRKVPHVIGHEVAGVVLESNDERFLITMRLAESANTVRPGEVFIAPSGKQQNFSRGVWQSGSPYHWAT
jgi:NADPH:quinone reductase-like Zn-dependent oxidoreductase